MRPRRQSMSEAEGAEVPPHEHRSVCPLMTHDKWSLSERAHNAVAPPMKAYKLGKERWSYNQLKVEIHDSTQRMRLDPKLAKTIDPKKLPVRQQGYSAAFDMEFMNGSRLKVMFYICYSVPRRIATETGHKYEWDLVTRDHCKNGCPGPILRPIQRLGKLGKRSNVPQTETADPNQTKDPKFVYLSIDECGSHVGDRKTTFFRLVVGAYEVREDRETLLGTTCSEPFTVVRNNDNTEGASYSPIQIPVKHSWAGWSFGAVQHMHDLPHVHLPAAKLPKSPNMSTSPLSTASVVPLYDGLWPALRRPDQPSPSVRQLFQQPDAQHEGFTHLESSRLQQQSAAVVQTGAGAYPLPSFNAGYSHGEGATSAPRRWGGVARRTGRGRAQAGSLGSREACQGSFHPHSEAHGRNVTEDFHQDYFPQGEHPECGFRPYADTSGQDMMDAFSRRQYQQRPDVQQHGFLTRMGPQSHVQPRPEEHYEPAHMQYADARIAMEPQYPGFQRSRPIATQQSETAEEFRFMLPEQSQAPMHKRARIMEDEHLFSCLPVHGLSYTGLPGHQGGHSMPFAHAPLPSLEEGAPSPRLHAFASQGGPESSQQCNAYASEPGADSAPYTAGTYPQDDKEGNVESLQTMLSDPESMAPALPLEISFAAEQAANSHRPMDGSGSAHPAVSASLEDYPHTEQLRAEELTLPPHFLLGQYLEQQSNAMPPLRTSSSGMGQDSWGSQSRTASAGETSISDIHHRPVEGQLSIQEEEFVNNLLRKEPGGEC